MYVTAVEPRLFDVTLTSDNTESSITIHKSYSKIIENILIMLRCTCI